MGWTTDPMSKLSDDARHSANDLGRAADCAKTFDGFGAAARYSRPTSTCSSPSGSAGTEPALVAARTCVVVALVIDARTESAFVAIRLARGPAGVRTRRDCRTHGAHTTPTRSPSLGRTTRVDRIDLRLSLSRRRIGGVGNLWLPQICEA